MTFVRGPLIFSLYKFNRTCRASTPNTMPTRVCTVDTGCLILSRVAVAPLPTAAGQGAGDVEEREEPHVRGQGAAPLGTDAAAEPNR